MFKSLLPLLWLIFTLSACVQKTSSSLFINPSNFPSLDFKINGGTSITNNPQVTINYSSSRSDLGGISIIQGPTCSETTWLPATAEVPLTLDNGDGEKMISMMVKSQYDFPSPCITKKIILDTKGPQILSVNHTTERNYYFGEYLELKVVFNEPATVVGSPRLALNIGGVTRYAEYVNGSGTTEHTYKYLVAFEDEDTDGLSLTTQVDLPPGSGIYDQIANASDGVMTPLNLEQINVAKIANSTTNSVYIANGMHILPEGSGTQKLAFIIALTDLTSTDVKINYVLINNATASERSKHNLPSEGQVTIPANSRYARLEFDFTGDQNENTDQIIGIQLTSTDHATIKADGYTQREVYIQDDEGTSTQFQSISARNKTTCGITKDGTLKCWGYSLYPGDAVMTSKSSPFTIDNGTTYSQVSVGDLHVCGITMSTEQVKCWGTNTSGQLGDGTTTTKSSSVLSADLTPYTQISSGGSHTCGITTTGVLKCWGDNSHGKLGDGTTANKNTPLTIDQGTNYVQVSAGQEHTCGITTTGTLKCWGYNLYGRLGDGTTTDRNSPVTIDPGTNYTQVSASRGHTCGITTTGTLKCWGGASGGQLGYGSISSQYSPVNIDLGVQYSKIAGGSDHTCGITDNNLLKCWGYNSRGEIGDGTTTQRNLPVVIDFGVKYTQVAGGSAHTCGINTNGTLKCWGGNDNGQIGDGAFSFEPTPSSVNSQLSFVKISSGSGHSCGITTTGSLMCWGRNDYGQLGDGTLRKKNSPVSIDPGTSFSKVSSSYYHTCGITTTGTLKCWGRNNYGQLGNDSYVDTSSPIVIDSSNQYKQVSAGHAHTCGVTLSGDLRCWGNNNSSQLGDGTQTLRKLPITIDSPNLYSQVSAGGSYTCGITTTGTLKCWGYNLNGNLGDGTNISKSVPTVIDSGTSYTTVFPGIANTCAITSTGTLKCWGANLSGQLGNGATSSTNVPVIIDASVEYSQITVGEYHTCGITSTGQLRCWGNNTYGQVGVSNTSLNILTPIPFDSSVSYSAVSAGQSHNCGLTTSGVLKCWGYNLHGQLGNASHDLSLPWPVKP